MNKSWTNCEQIVNILWTNYERVRQNAQKKNKCSIDYCTYCTNAGNIWKFIEQMFSSKWRTRTNVLVKLHKLIEQMFVNSEYCRKYDVDFVHIDCWKLCGKVENFCQDGILHKIWLRYLCKMTNGLVDRIFYLGKKF